MAQRKESEPLKRVTLHVYEADYDRLRALYTMGPQRAIRQIIRAHLARVASRVAATEPLVPEIDFDLEEEA